MSKSFDEWFLDCEKRYGRDSSNESKENFESDERRTQDINLRKKIELNDFGDAIWVDYAENDIVNEQVAPPDTGGINYGSVEDDDADLQEMWDEYCKALEKAKNESKD